MIEKPKDWPANNHEAKIASVYEYIEKYCNEPTIANKEILISLINQDELNEIDSRGMVRFSKYEYYLLSKIYLKAQMLMFNGIKVFVYRHIIDNIIQHHSISMICDENGIEIDKEPIKELIRPLDLFYVCYYNFRYYYKKSFCDSILKMSDDIDYNDKMQVDLFCNGLLTMMNDLSYNTNANVFICINFSREDIYSIYKLIFKCLNILYPEQQINKSPLHGVLCTSISNWILKSRYNYNKDPIYKSLPNEAAFNYEEVWMRTIESLNDKREGKVINEVLADSSWKKYNWMNIEEIHSIRKTYLTCFSKQKPNDEMKGKYGENYYAYKSDRIADLISPQVLYNTLWANGQVFFFDVIYDKELLKEELNFLASIIDLSNEDVSSKKAFFDDILQYWIYSIKDADKWASERERRYVCYFYDNYKYKNIKEENGFMKIKSSLFMFPDFINHNNCMFNQLYANVHLKLTKLHKKRFLFCYNCLYSDFDNFVTSKLSNCPNCNSKNITFINDDSSSEG